MKTAFILTILTFGMFAFVPHTAAQDFSQWHLPEGVKTRFGKGAANKVKFSPDNTQIAVTTTIGIWIYDAETSQESNLLIGPGIVFSLVYSPDGSTLASGYGTGEIRLWDTHTGRLKQILKQHTKRVFSLLYSPDGPRE